MRRKHLESALSSIQREFPSPDVTLEQYPTSAQLAASVILTALENGDIGPGRSAIDLGCGTGMLALGVALVDTDWVLGVDCDASALTVAVNNTLELELEDQVDFVLGRVKDTGIKEETSPRPATGHPRRSGRGRGRKPDTRTPPPPAHAPMMLTDDDGLALQSKCVDTVLTNPPFGTKSNAGMDVRFLRTATRLARRTVYSFHKTSTRPFLIRTVESWGMQLDVVAEMKFDISRTYKFHKEKSLDVEVDLLRVHVPMEDTDSSQT